MPNRTDASVAFSVTDNLSASIVGMKNSVNSFESDITGLQQKLDQLDATRIQLKNFDLKNARQELTRTRQALEELGDAATDAERAAAQADFDQAVQNYANLEHQLNLVSKQARQTEKDMLAATNGPGAPAAGLAPFWPLWVPPDWGRWRERRPRRSPTR